MNTQLRQLALFGLAFLFPFASAAFARAEEAPALPDGIVVQTRGPVHEAYAEPHRSTPGPGAVVPKQPPDSIPEVPPDQKPEAESAQWIPGYWGWDEDRKDFIWISGLWRIPPPDRRWVAGHWTQTDDGWQWVPGFWASTAQEQIDYLTAPPESLDYGPSVEAPSEESVYVPGTWVPRERRYYWRPGYWTDYRPNYVWTPARYYWTPAGYTFCDGYWDYTLEDRGLLFAPVYFTQSYWNDPSWYYRPYYGIRPLALLASLFLRPRYDSYYFGDYYDPFYARLGYRPWFTFGNGYYDPLFSYYRWQYRGDPGWFQTLGDNFIARRDGVLARPPRTLAEQAVALNGAARLSPVERSALQVAAPLNQLRNDNIRLTRATAAEITRQRAAADGLRALSAARARTEKSAAAVAPKRPGRPQVATSLAQLQLPPAPRVNPTAATQDRPKPVPGGTPAKPRPFASPGPSNTKPQERPRPQQTAPPVQRPQSSPAPQSRPRPEVRPPVQRPQSSPAPQSRPRPEVRPPVQRPQSSPAPQSRPRPEVRPPVQRPQSSPAPQSRPRPEVRPPVQRPQSSPAPRQAPRASPPPSARPAPPPQAAPAPRIQRSSPPPRPSQPSRPSSDRSDHKKK